MVWGQRKRAGRRGVAIPSVMSAAVFDCELRNSYTRKCRSVAATSGHRHLLTAALWSTNGGHQFDVSVAVVEISHPNPYAALLPSAYVLGGDSDIRVSGNDVQVTLCKYPIDRRGVGSNTGPMLVNIRCDAPSVVGRPHKCRWVVTAFAHTPLPKVGQRTVE